MEGELEGYKKVNTRFDHGMGEDVEQIDCLL